MWDQIDPDVLQSPLAVGAAAVIVGAVYCFLGYRLLRFIIGLTGFLLAGGVAAGLAALISRNDPIVMGVAGLIGGISGALAMAFLYRAGIFLVGLLGAGIAAHTILADMLEPWNPWATLGVALAGGLVALLLERPVMRLATATIGAWIMVGATASLILPGGIQDLKDAANLPVRTQWLLAGVWLVLTIAGAAVQSGMRPRRAPTPAAEGE